MGRRGSDSKYVCRYNNRVREVIEDIRIEGIIARDLEGAILQRVSAVLTTLNYSEPKWRKTYKELLDLYENSLEKKLSHTPFNLKEYAETLNELIGRELFRLEDRRIKISDLKNGCGLTNRALDRISIRLNEDVAALLITCDDLNAIIECENESDLEFLLMTSHKDQ